MDKAKSKKLHPHLVDSIVPAGEHRFPFQFKITGSRLPTSFKGPLGYIRYYVGAKLVQCSSKEDIVASVEIPFVETMVAAKMMMLARFLPGCFRLILN